MFYVYVLRSCSDNGFYVGSTKDLRERLKAHNSGRVRSTEKRLPVELVYYEACLNQNDAFRREKYLKTAYGKRYLKNRLRDYFTGWMEAWQKQRYMAHFVSKLSDADGEQAETQHWVVLVLHANTSPTRHTDTCWRSAKKSAKCWARWWRNLKNGVLAFVVSPLSSALWPLSSVFCPTQTAWQASSIHI